MKPPPLDDFNFPEWYSNGEIYWWSPQQKMKPPPLDDFNFPGRYSNGWMYWWSSGSWEEYTNAADQLDVVRSDEGFYSLQKKKCSAVFTRCHQDLVSSELSWYGEIKLDIFHRVIPYSKITMTDCKNFGRLLLEAERNLLIFEDYFTPHGEPAMLQVQHDSTVENVVAQLPLRYFNNARGPFFRPLLERLISIAKKEHEEKLYHEYTLFLVNCGGIKTDATAAECLEMLTDNPQFVANKFGDLESHRLEHGMQIYLNCREACGENTAFYIAKMEYDYQIQQKDMLKARRGLPMELMSPIHFLAFQKLHKEGYHVQHLVKEIMKFRAYFGVFLNGVPPLWCPEPPAAPAPALPPSPSPSPPPSPLSSSWSPLSSSWSPSPSPSPSSSSSSERPKKQVCHLQT